MMKPLAFALAALAVTACAAPPTEPLSPMQKAANRSVGFAYAAENCGSLVGGFSDIREIQSLARQNRKQAIEMGAIESDFANAQRNIAGRFMTGSILAGDASTCNALMNGLARAA